MLTECELWACADEYLRQHGPDARIYASKRADKLLELSDIDGFHNWRLIAHRIDQLIIQSEACLN